MLSKVNGGGGRITYLDFTKCVAIWLVLWGHSIIQLMNHNLNGNLVYGFIYSFHMPLFMLVSGFFAQSSFKLPIKELIIKKFKQLIYPSLTFGFLWYGLDCILGNRILSFNAFIHLEAAAYWFLKALFFAYVIAYLTYRCRRWKSLFIIVACLFFCLIQLKGGTFFKMGTMLPFFYIGMWTKKLMPQIKHHKYVLLLCAFILFAATFHFYSSEKNSFAIPFFNTLSLSAAKNYILCLVTGLSGSITVIMSCLLITEKWKTNRVVQIGTDIGKYTLGIYLLQKLLVEILLPHFIKIEMNIWVFDLILTPVVATLFLFICYRITQWIYRNRYIKGCLMRDF